MSELAKIEMLLDALREVLADNKRRYAAYGPAGIPLSRSVEAQVRRAIALTERADVATHPIGEERRD
jgi:hypothetical protein